MSARIVLPTVAFIGILLLAVALTHSGSPASAQSQSTIGLIGADAITQGNTATALGPRDSCVRTEVGSEVTIDIVVDAVPADRPMLGLQINVRYDANLLEAVKANSDMLLGAVGNYQPFPGLSDPLPDTDGDYLVVNADLASMTPTEADPDGANMESGPGVLTRVTFRAKAPGRSSVGPAFEGADVYPSIIDAQNTSIGVDSIASTVVAIGEDCGVVPPADQVTVLPPITEIIPLPSGSTPRPTPRVLPPGATPDPTETPGPSTSPGTPTPDRSRSPTPTAAVLPPAGDGTDTGAVALGAVLALLGAAAAGAGGFILYRRAQATQGPAAS